MNKSSSRKNPSRELCEKTIRRILNTELMELGENRHFRSAADFMNYFESLYPASDALTKQVQRAVKALDMAKDENGFFIVDKTADQVEQDRELSRILSNSHAVVDAMENCQTVLVSCDAPVREYLIHMLESAESFREKFLTIVPASNGIVIYTRNKKDFLEVLNSLTI
jgi:polynucleotide 5'-kinase involved in rRNA processing